MESLSYTFSLNFHRSLCTPRTAVTATLHRKKRRPRHLVCPGTASSEMQSQGSNPGSPTLKPVFLRGQLCVWSHITVSDKVREWSSQSAHGTCRNCLTQRKPSRTSWEGRSQDSLGAVPGSHRSGQVERWCPSQCPAGLHKGRGSRICSVKEYVTEIENKPPEALPDLSPKKE